MHDLEFCRVTTTYIFHCRTVEPVSQEHQIGDIAMMGQDFEAARKSAKSALLAWLASDEMASLREPLLERIMPRYL